MCPGVQVLHLSLTPTVRLRIQQHEPPTVCYTLTVLVSCDQDFEYSKKQKNKQQQPKPGKVFFITIWPLWPRMRLLCALGLFVALLHLSTSLLLGAFNIKTFGDKKSSNTTLMNIISTVWKLQFIFPIPFLKRCSYTHFCISFVSDWNICKLQIIKIYKKKQQKKKKHRL